MKNSLQITLIKAVEDVRSLDFELACIIWHVVIIQNNTHTHTEIVIIGRLGPT